jgi:hypothetical protein
VRSLRSESTASHPNKWSGRNLCALSVILRFALRFFALLFADKRRSHAGSARK